MGTVIHAETRFKKHYRFEFSFEDLMRYAEGLAKELHEKSDGLVKEFEIEINPEKKDD